MLCPTPITNKLRPGLVLQDQYANKWMLTEDVDLSLSATGVNAERTSGSLISIYMP